MQSRVNFVQVGLTREYIFGHVGVGYNIYRRD